LILSTHVGSCAKKGTTNETVFYCGSGSNCNDLSNIAYSVSVPNFLTLSGPCDSSIDPNIKFKNLTYTVCI